MSGTRDIIESIQKLSGSQLSDNVKLFAATVESVDLSTRSCVVTTISSQGSITIEGVQLMAAIDDGVLIVPVIGSTVLVVYSTFNKPFIAMFSEVDTITMTAGTNNATMQIDATGLLMEINQTKLTMTDGLTKFNDGQLGGMVKVLELVAKLNNLEDLVNDLISKYNAHTHLLTLSTGTGTAAATLTQETGTLTPTVRADIENDKITQ